MTVSHTCLIFHDLDNIEEYCPILKPQSLLLQLAEKERDSGGATLDSQKPQLRGAVHPFYFWYGAMEITSSM